jgi:prepilin peptidase CpaA
MQMIATLFCLAFPCLLIYAAWHDISTMTIPNWVSIALGVAFIPAALTCGLSAPQIGMHLAVGAATLLICATLFYLNIFGGGDAKVISAASLWMGLAGANRFVFCMAVAGGCLALLLIILRRMKISSKRPWAKRLLSPSEGAPYAVAIAIGALLAAPASPMLATGMSALGV